MLHVAASEPLGDHVCILGAVLGDMISNDSPSANSCKAAAEFEASNDGPVVARFRAGG